MNQKPKEDLYQEKERKAENKTKFKQKMLDPDLDEYLNEYRLQIPVEPVSHYEGELNITKPIKFKLLIFTSILFIFKNIFDQILHNLLN